MTYSPPSPFEPDIAFASCSTQDNIYASLPIEEQKCLGLSASPKRRNEFALGRKAANMAMRDLGVSNPGPVLRTADRNPLWPEGVIGSISHTESVGIAAASYQSRYESIGIDLHLLSDPRLNKDNSALLSRIGHESEIAWVMSDSSQQAQRSALLFSAKESIFKALYPIYQANILFKDVELTWQDGSFEAELLFDASKKLKRGSTLIVKCVTDALYVITGVAIEAYNRQKPNIIKGIAIT